MFAIVFNAVNGHLNHLKFCVVCIYGRRYVCCGECNVISNVTHFYCWVCVLVAWV